MHRAEYLRALAFLVVAAVLASGAPSASAQDVALKVVVPKAAAQPAGDGDETASAKVAIPFVRATITSDRIGLKPKDFLLKLEEAEPKVAVEATRAVTYPNSDEPMALVILIEGDLSWMGNETYAGEGDDGEVSKIEGAFTGLAPAIDSFKTAGPKGSRAAVIVYADAAVTKHPMSDISKLSGSTIGGQKDYTDISKSLIVGLEEAWKLLAKESGRRVLVVIGNGEDTKEDVGPDLKRVVGQLKEANIETYSIRYTNSESGAQGLTNMNQIGYTKHDNATSRDHFASKSKNIVELIGAKYYVDFPGDELPWDGAEHLFIPSVGGEELEEIPLQLPEFDIPRSSEGGLWWLWLLIVLAVVVVIVVIILIARRKPKAAPMVMEEIPEPMPSGPKKTVMFNLNAGSEYPVVGWIVPLSGPNQFQTFKLLQGATKIGTGGESDIVIDDGFMSTVHAEIACKQSGFILQDGGSTNGSFVNERRISEHELVDNDRFVLGKTQFKFKSIN